MGGEGGGEEGGGGRGMEKGAGGWWGGYCHYHEFLKYMPRACMADLTCHDC